ncbi:MAG: methyltransferase [Kiritimatiellaeota bacterium]|nr:methyltransferase [Kiritimatiellota bacterium]
MDDLSAPVADEVVACLKKIPFRHALDIGGASGTWTMALLRIQPRATATLFDLPVVLPLARRRLGANGFLKRVQLAGGDFMRDLLPRGADLAWVSAIIHQNSRAENRKLFGNVFAALEPGGWIGIRDIIMEPNRAAPVSGALFAVNMLVSTRGGSTFTFSEIRADLRAAGFTAARILRREPTMNCVVAARKPA